MKENYKILYSEIVNTLSKFSTDKKLNVGALLLKDGRIIATGYNGQPSGQAHIPVLYDGHDISTIHAEENCLLFAAKNGIATKYCEIFVTHFPCVHCMKSLFQAGICKIYYLNDYRNEDNFYKK